MQFWKPDFEFPHICQIPVEVLQRVQIRGLLIDLDNTIAPWNTYDLTPAVKEWFREVEKAGIRLCIFSNNRNPQRVSTVGDELGILYISKAGKPWRRAYQRGQEILGLPPQAIAVIGDQIFTDIVGGKRAGMKTIMVDPISDHDFPGSKFVRWLERMVGRTHGR